MKMVLASTSERRRDILERAGFVFEMIPSGYVEDMTLPLSAHELAKAISLGKAKIIAQKQPESVVLSADTFVVLGDKVFGKPISREHAKKMLEELSGKTHTVITGVTVMFQDHLFQEVYRSYVTMRELQNEQIEYYLDNYSYQDKAGAYAIQDIGKTFVKEIMGSYTNVMGLPIEETKVALARFGVFPA